MPLAQAPAADQYIFNVALAIGGRTVLFPGGHSAVGATALTWPAAKASKRIFLRATEVRDIRCGLPPPLSLRSDTCLHSSISHGPSPNAPAHPPTPAFHQKERPAHWRELLRPTGAVPEARGHRQLRSELRNLRRRRGGGRRGARAAGHHGDRCGLRAPAAGGEGPVRLAHGLDPPCIPWLTLPTVARMACTRLLQHWHGFTDRLPLLLLPTVLMSCSYSRRTSKRCSRLQPRAGSRCRRTQRRARTAPGGSLAAGSASRRVPSPFQSPAIRLLRFHHRASVLVLPSASSVCI